MPFILMTTFAVMNLIVGLIVNSMQEAASEETREEVQAFETAILARLDEIDRKLDKNA
jgi:voltage-gated sodium channel